MARSEVGVADSLHGELGAFDGFGRRTLVEPRLVAVAGGLRPLPYYVNEWWTARQRAANPLHEISYRACFKPQLPAFFIERLTAPGDRVHDPFMGRGTTLLEAALRGRRPSGCDVNPLARMLLEPRLAPPELDAVAARLAAIDLRRDAEADPDLGVFYHPETLREIAALRAYLLGREAAGALDGVDRWIRMVAVNRLTGHSPGFFSVYTLPPNQAVSVTAQRRINERRGQVPPRRPIAERILRKSRSLLAGVDAATRRRLHEVAAGAAVLCGDSAATPEIADGSVDLVVTSPPFLDVVQYREDNWLRCWFCGIAAGAVPLRLHRRLADWTAAMAAVLAEQRRILRPGGHVAFEVGEVRRGTVALDEAVVAAAGRAGLEPDLVLVQDQEFTKTANCWGVANNRAGTNSHRIVLLRRP